ncbi:uncharacterized protein LOC106648825 [Trichogramma pretiosum]|uniref:uncharacterized protein LOC106648825 n=1 Tax=Trichogramma pretiosum TaxID=7493 RepID=UPI0006C9D13E|nr:uncharacterized protein LOC106648825 [Trichogramma pretiosum]XP_014221426.1 uncharacterized protein LOC106648825 [Trichogramma pretiosum]
MPHPCVVCGRSRLNPNNKLEDYAFFGFPVGDESRCKKWLEFCCREELYALSKKQLLQRMICSKHFQPSDFVTKFNDRLNSAAVPSIYDPKQSLYKIGCVLCGRFRKDPPGPENDGATFHHFPGEEFRCLEWLDFVGVDSYFRLTRKEIMYCYICSKHFDKTQFMPGFCNRLTESAVPNIRLPDEYQEQQMDFETEVIVTNAIESGILFNSSKEDEILLDPLPATVLDSQACAACGRLRNDPKNKKEKYKFHPFPAYEIGRCLKWCQFLGREDILKMSPNQIRKLILCSAHFEVGQNFFNSNGPCDAVPTIWRSGIQDEICISTDISNVVEGETSKVVRPLVSSRKPKIDPKVKPAPLAKKRGKSKRPTCINLPKIDSVAHSITQKLPIPSVNNWKLMNNQLNSFSISNNVVNTASQGINKVIVPFSGDISKLGAPIPVQSLASIPPGLLIKINLPDQNKMSVIPDQEMTPKQLQPLTIQPYEIVAIKNELSPNEIQNGTDSEKIIKPALQCQEETYNENYEELIETSISVAEETIDDRASEDVVDSSVPWKSKKTTKGRKILLPIHRELRRFYLNIRPLLKRLPKKTKARVKLGIVNMVIDKL